MLPEPAEYLAPDALDHEIFEATVPQDHYLRRVHTVIDFERFRADMVSCYSANHGRPATEPLLLLKLEFLEYQYNLADQSVVEQARFNMAFRYFLNLSLKSPVTHLRDIVTWIEESIAVDSLAPSTEPAWQAVQEALQIAHKVLADRENPKSKDRLVTLQDPDARWGEHHVHYAGYLLDVAEDADSGIITALNVLPANGDEARDASTLIEQEERAHGNDVDALSMDGAGCKGELLREWTDPQGLNLDVIVPPRPRPKAAEYFGVDQFTLTPDGEAMICPAGQTSNQRFRNRHNSGWVFRFTRKVCAACPLLSQCIAKLQKAKGRQVSTNDYEAEYQAIEAKAQTPAYQEIRRQHRRIERKLGELVRWHRLRRARYRGRMRVLLQSLLTALVVNIKCVVRSLAAPPVRAEGLTSP